MDIATRLKEFLDYTGMQSTQFADACGIPRPSFSQLLRGRNRKVSDEVIAKIHEAFPRLSVLWLMFGEGDMVQSVNNEISEPKTFANPLPLFDECVNNQSDICENNTVEFHRNFPESVDLPPVSEITSKKEASELLNTSHTTGTPMPDGGAYASKLQTTVNRHVERIMIFYSDQSFETFIPDNSN